MNYTIINPPELGAPRGWNHGMLAPSGGRVLFVAGQTARDASGRVPPEDFVTQFGLAIDNVLRVVRAAGGDAGHIGRMTIFVTDIAGYRANLKPLGAIWRERMGRNYPAMALMEVTSLVDESARVEIEATAIIPAPAHLHDADPPPLLA